MEEKILKSISPVPYGLMMGAITGIVYLAIAILIALIWLPALPSLSTPTVPGLGELLAGIGIFMVILMPIIGFAAGFVIGVIFALLYNFLAPKIGGIRVTFEDGSKTVQ